MDGLLIFRCGKKMLLNKNLCVALLLVLLMAINSGDASALTESDREIYLAVAKRQAQMYDAKIKNDWTVMYSLLTDKYRSRISYEGFFTSPLPDDEEKKFAISGSKMTDDPQEGTYYPVHLGYRFMDFHISDDKKMVRVASKITTMAPQFVGPVTIDYADEEFWIRTGSGWKASAWQAQWDTKYLIHASGAATNPKTPKLPKFTTHVKAAELARWFVNEALKLPDGKKRTLLLNKAIVVDVFSAVEALAETKSDAEERVVLPFAIKQINRQILAHPVVQMYFEQLMAAGRWLGIAGDHESSYEKYRTARGMDGFIEEAHAGLSNEAIRLGKLEDAARHYIDLLKLTSITQSSQTTLMEQQIEEECALCKKLSTDTKVDLAKNLVNARKWKEAYNVFSCLLKEEKSWRKAAKKLKAGKSVKLREAVGEKIADIAEDFTFDELTRLLNAGGINLYHPGDIPEKVRSIDGSLTIESVPKVRRANYKGFYKMSWQPAKAVIKWNGMDSSKKSTTHGGYLAVTLKKGSAPVKKLYRDRVPTAAGNEQLIKDIKKLKRGESIILARVPFSNVTMDHFLIGGLATIGVDAGLLQGSIGAQVIIGTKGMPIGGAKVYSGKHALRKVFTPPNIANAKNRKTPAVIITGIGEKATISYIPPGR